MVDSNHRRRSQQIYSLSPLATREIPHIHLELVDGLEPPTCWLQISCSTNWAIPAHLTAGVSLSDINQFVNKKFFIFSFFYHSQRRSLYSCENIPCILRISNRIPLYAAAVCAAATCTIWMNFMSSTAWLCAKTACRTSHGRNTVPFGSPAENGGNYDITGTVLWI